MNQMSKLDAFIQQAVTAMPISGTSLIASLYGDALLQRGGEVWLGSVAALLEGLGFGERFVRTALFRLNKEEWLDVVRIGRRSFYRLSDKGLRLTRRAEHKIYRANAPEWDGTWLLLLPGWWTIVAGGSGVENMGWYGFYLLFLFGLGAVIMRGAQRGKRLLGPMAYLQSAVANAMPQQSKFTLTLDGRQVQSEGLGVLLVNFSKIQFDIAVTHDNKPRDGEFDVVVLKAKTAFDLIPAAIAGLLDRDGEFPDRTDALEIFRAKVMTKMQAGSLSLLVRMGLRAQGR